MVYGEVYGEVYGDMVYGEIAVSVLHRQVISGIIRNS